MHWSLKCTAISFGLIILLVAFIAAVRFTCQQAWESGYVESGRVTSPDSNLDAVIVTDIAGDRVMMVYLRPSGEKMTNFDGEQFYANKVYGLAVHWIGPNLLEIHYQKAQINRFSNIWTTNQFVFQSQGVPPKLYTVEIKLVKDGDEELDILHE